MMSRRRKVETGALCLAFLLFFRALHAFEIGYSDSLCYTEWLYKFLGRSLSGCESTSYLPGVALLWYPMGILARLGGWISGISEDTWIPILIGLTSFACWGAALIFIGRAESVHREETGTGQRSPAYWPLLFLLNVPVLHYATDRTPVSHAGEIFLASLTLYCLLRSRHWLALIFGLWLTGTRLNDAPVMLVLIGSLMDQRSLRKIPGTAVGLASLLALTTATGATLYVGLVRGYNGIHLPFLLGHFNPTRLAHVLGGADWGMFWTAPWWLLVLAMGFWRLRDLSWRARGGVAWMTHNFILCVCWTGNGGDFAYRYLMGSYFGALLVWLEVGPWLSEKVKRAAHWVLCGEAIWMTYLTWLYRTRDVLCPWGMPEGYFNHPTLQLVTLEQLAHPFYLIKPLGLSPLGLSALSWARPLLLRHEGASFPVTTGPRLWALSLASCVALAVLGNLARRSASWSISFFLSFWSAQLRGKLCKLNLAVTSICNSRCQSCHIWKEPKSLAAGDLTVADYRTLFQNAPKTICWLSITGGEPFLRDDLAEIFEAAIQHLPRLRLLSITTNSLIPHRPAAVIERTLLASPKLRVYLNLSLDGEGPLHDELRGTRGNFLAVERLRADLRPLEERFQSRLRLCFETTLLRPNREGAQAVATLARESGVSHMLTLGQSSSFYKRTPGAKPEDRLFLAAKEAAAFFGRYLRGVAPQLSLESLMRRAFYQGFIESDKTKGHPVRCSAARNSLFIDSRGTASPCIHWPVDLGNGAQQPLGEIHASEGSARTVEEIRKQRCPGCWTPCEAMHSLLASPIKMLGLGTKSFVG